jgi:hypothetical protein
MAGKNVVDPFVRHAGLLCGTRASVDDGMALVGWDRPAMDSSVRQRASPHRRKIILPPLGVSDTSEQKLMARDRAMAAEKQPTIAHLSEDSRAEPNLDQRDRHRD